jgi:hypothetical protein
VNVAVWAASLLGLVLGASIAFVIGKRLLLPVVEKSSRPDFLARWGIAGLAVSALPSILLAFVVGATLGGAWGEYLLTGAPWSGVPLGVAAGIAVVLAAVLLGGTA